MSGARPDACRAVRPIETLAARDWLIEMAGADGIEPPTFAL